MPARSRQTPKPRGGPDDKVRWLEIAWAHHSAGRLAEAEQTCRQVLSARPRHSGALQLLAVLAREAGREEEAIDLFRRAITTDSDCVAADTRLGRLFEARGDFEAAVICYRRAARLRPTDAEAHASLGRGLHGLGKCEQAAASYRRAVALRPDFADAYCNLADALRREGRLEEAKVAAERAVAINPELAEAHNNLGNALRERGDPAAAAACYERALALRRDWPEAHNNLANVLGELGHTAEAIAHYEQALALKPDIPEVYNNLGRALAECGRTADAIAAVAHAITLRPGYHEAVVQRAHLKALLCDWREDEGDAARVLDILRSHSGVVPPWNLQGQQSTLADQLLCAQQWSGLKTRGRPAPFVHPPRGSSPKIRLGYLSADFREHPVGYAIAETIERHDRMRFEIFGYSYGPDDGSELRRRFETAFDRFRDFSLLADDVAARQIHADQIDILIDLTAHTRHARPRILASRPAPVQANYLGFCGATGADWIDYVLVDEFVVPPGQSPFFSEKLVHLAGCWWPAAMHAEFTGPPPSRRTYGLPQDGFVFCCFNTNYKITRPVFDIWMRLLDEVPASVLWLNPTNLEVVANLCRAAEQRGVDPARVVFSPMEPLPAYLARQRLADLFLDTLPYNAVSTAYNALYAGLPVLTRVGQTFVGRTAGTMLLAAGLPELVTTSAVEYERTALQLARSPELLRDIRQRLARARSSAPLFDPTRFARDSEAAYERMREIWRAGEPPRPFSLAAAPL